MITRLDHVRIESDDFAACSSHYERLLGHSAAREEQRARAELPLENCALVIEASGATGTRLGSLVFACADLDATRRALTACGATARQSTAAAAPEASRAYPSDAFGVAITLVSAQGRASLERPAPSSLSALDHVVVRTPDVARARSLYGGLGLRLALERDFRGVRMLFFRIAGVTVEVVEDPARERDVLHGLAYRTRDIHAAHARLREEGLTVSEVRPGRKEGTHVFTVREGACDIPTLVLSDPSRA